MRRDDLDFPAILRTSEEYDRLMDTYRRAENDGIPEEWQRPAAGAGMALAIGFLLAFVAMLAVAFIVEVLP